MTRNSKEYRWAIIRRKNSKGFVSYQFVIDKKPIRDPAYFSVPEDDDDDYLTEESDDQTT